jgi:hypothetical protein
MEAFRATASVSNPDAREPRALKAPTKRASGRVSEAIEIRPEAFKATPAAPKYLL